MKHADIRKKLSGAGLNIFSSQEVRRATGMTGNAVRLWLIRCIDSGLVLPLKKRRGVYCFAENIPNDWIVANRLYQPSYISCETALSYYGLLPESVYSTTSITTKITRRFEALGKEFTYQKIKRAAFCGYVPVKVKSQTVLLAEKEKALADYLYFVYLGKKALNSRLKFADMNMKKTCAYLEKFQKARFTEWGKNVIGKRDQGIRG